MDFDIKIFKGYALNQSRVDFDGVQWDISGSNEGRDLTVSSSTLENIVYTDFFVFKGVSKLMLKEEYYDFKNEDCINNDNAYKVLSTMAFDWSIKMLFYSLVKDSKMNFNKFMRELASSDQCKSLYDSLYKIANCYELSPLREK